MCKVCRKNEAGTSLSGDVSAGIFRGVSTLRLTEGYTAALRSAMSFGILVVTWIPPIGNVQPLLIGGLLCCLLEIRLLWFFRWPFQVNLELMELSLLLGAFQGVEASCR